MQSGAQSVPKPSEAPVYWFVQDAPLGQTVPASENAILSVDVLISRPTLVPGSECQAADRVSRPYTALPSRKQPVLPRRVLA